MALCATSRDSVKMAPLSEAEEEALSDDDCDDDGVDLNEEESGEDDNQLGSLLAIRASPSRCRNRLPPRNSTSQPGSHSSKESKNNRYWLIFKLFCGPTSSRPTRAEGAVRAATHQDPTFTMSQIRPQAPFYPFFTCFVH
jgi:hypothetical protein